LQSPQADAQHLGGELPVAAYVFECKFGSEQEFDGHRILSGFRQIPIFRPDRRHALVFSSR